MQLAHEIVTAEMMSCYGVPSYKW